MCLEDDDRELLQSKTLGVQEKVGIINSELLNWRSSW